MPRLLAFILTLSIPAFARADAFDNYTNRILAGVPESKSARRIKELTPELMVEHSRALPGITAAFVAVKTNEGRWARLLVQPARQKISATESIPILLIERFATFREGEERAIDVQGQNVRLFDGFRFSLDLGQVVPERLGGDIRFVVDGEDVVAEPVNKAEIYLITKHFPEATPKKGPKFVPGAAFEPRHFSGTYKLHDDGRRTGTLKLVVGETGVVTGSFYSDKDGAKYDVGGKVGSPSHAIDFNVSFPRTIQTFHGWIFTGDGRVITGSARMQDRETGFYAIRQE